MERLDKAPEKKTYAKPVLVSQKVTLGVYGEYRPVERVTLPGGGRGSRNP